MGAFFQGPDEDSPNVESPSVIPLELFELNPLDGDRKQFLLRVRSKTFSGDIFESFLRVSFLLLYIMYTEEIVRESRQYAAESI